MRRFPRLEVPEFEVFAKLDTPAKIQDFLDTLPINFERSGETSRSPLMTLRCRKAHCMEGAYLAAAILWYHGHAPLIMNLKTTAEDTGHAVALFRQDGKWGAISKTNHAVLRYRDPVFASPRELAMSYFNEYFRNNGRKTLRSYSKPFKMLAYGTDWLTSRTHIWPITYAIEDSVHIDILDSGMRARLRPADAIEIAAGKLTDWKRP